MPQPIDAAAAESFRGFARLELLREESEDMDADVRFIPSVSAASQAAASSDRSAELQNAGEVTTIRPATPPSAGRRGPVPKRRFQEGTLREENEHYYSFFYRDRQMEDGSNKSVFTRFDLGRVEDISELSARREHDRLRNQINRERGAVPPAPRGEKFKDVAFAYMKNIAPHLSPSTARQRKSHLRAHLLPRFEDSSLMAMDSLTLQCFSTELLVRLSRKSILNVLGTLFAVLGVREAVWYSRVGCFLRFNQGRR